MKVHGDQLILTVKCIQKEPQDMQFIYPTTGSDFPEWAQDRKEIIISRIKGELKAPTFTVIETGLENTT